MSISQRARKWVLIALVIFTFGAWFADGYLRWVNSDTAGEAAGTSQDIRFPYGLISPHYKFHARVTATLLSYVPFHTIGYLYHKMTHDPVTALYVSQGATSGLIYVSFLLISAAYVSLLASIVSPRYLISAAILALLMVALPVLPLDKPFSLTVHFDHHSVMTNYVGTLMIALCALYPFWRFICTGKWEDWYSNIRLRILFYALIVAAVFSSTVTMLWLGGVAALGVLSITWNEARTRNGLRTLPARLLNDSRVVSLLLIIACVIAGTLAEALQTRRNLTVTSIRSVEYVRTVFLFFQKGSYPFIAAVLCGLVATLASSNGKKRVGLANAVLPVDQGGGTAHYKRGLLSSHQGPLCRILPWLLIGNLLFIFVIGLPKVPYRFGGYNLGPDTILPATWTITLWLVAAIIDLRERKIWAWIATPLILALLTGAIFFFTFPSYKSRETQRMILTRLHQEDVSVPADRSLPIPVEHIAFSAHECKVYTIPFLRQMGVISSERKIDVVSQAEYNIWHPQVSNTSGSSALNAENP